MITSLVVVRAIFDALNAFLCSLLKGSQDFDAPNLEDEFGTLSLQPTTNKDGTPLCPSHGVVCKKGICRDYADLLKKIERGKKTASSNNGGNYCFRLTVPCSAHR
jgi:hypothetical protein